jgi:hypothetical protein
LKNSPNFQYHKFEDKNSGQDPTWLLQNLFLFLLDRSNKPEWCKWWQQGGMEMWNQPNELGRPWVIRAISTTSKEGLGCQSSGKQFRSLNVLGSL